MEKRKAASLVKYSISDRNFLNKTLHSSSRYANVKAKINSGFNEKRRHELELEIRKYYKIKSDEVFRRISLIDLLHLLLVYAEECAITHKTVSENEQKQGLNNIEGESMGAIAILEEPVCPLLILDVRSEKEFSIGHLTTAVSYPHYKLSKAFNWESAEMLCYKNHSDYIIVICDENETLSPGVATTLIQRGYDNIFVLSGGLKLADDKIGPPFVTTNESRIISPETAEFLYQIVTTSLKPCNNLEWWLLKKTDNMDSNKELPAIHYDIKLSERK